MTAPTTEGRALADRMAADAIQGALIRLRATIAANDPHRERLEPGTTETWTACEARLVALCERLGGV